MATDYGVALKALDDLPLRGEIVRGLDAANYRLARRLLTPADGYADCGDPIPYLSLDLRMKIGTRLSEEDLRQLEREAAAALREEESVDVVTCEIAYASRGLQVRVRGAGVDGTFGFLLTIEDVDSVTLESF